MMPKPVVPTGRHAVAALEFEVATFAYEVEAFKIQTQLNKGYSWVGLPQDGRPEIAPKPDRR